MSEDTMHLLLEINRLKAEILVKDTEIKELKLKHDILAVTSCACGLKKASEK